MSDIPAWITASAAAISSASILLLLVQNRIAKRQVDAITSQTNVLGEQLKLVRSQTFALERQIEEQRRGNQVALTFSLLQDDRRVAGREELYAAFDTLAIPRQAQSPLSPTEIEAILSNATTRAAAAKYLAHFEQLCVAANVGAIDETILRRILGDRIIWAYERFEPYIENRRIFHEQPRLYADVKETIERWSLDPAPSLPGPSDLIGEPEILDSNKLSK